MDINSRVAENLRALREEKKLSLDAVARLTGVSKSMLGQIERGEVNPTISVLWKIAGGLKLSFTSLLEEKNVDVELVRREDISPIEEDEGKYQNYPLFSFDEQRRFEIYRIVIAPGGSLNALGHLSGTEEFLTVFSGEVEITAGEQRKRLREGDFLRFRADVPHGYQNVGEGEVQLSMVIFYV